MSRTVTETLEKSMASYNLKLNHVDINSAGKEDHPPRLPSEIYQAIIDHLPRQTLKNVRLANKFFALMAEPRLFRKVVLVPSVDCLNDFLIDFDRSRTRYLVCKFVYDDRWLTSLHRLKTRMEKTQNEETDHALSKKHIAMVEKIQNAYLSAKEDATLEVALLSRIFRRLSKLQQIRIIEEQTGGSLPEAEIPRYLKCHCTALGTSDLSVHGSSWSRNSLRTQSALMATFTERRPIQVLKATNLTWTRLFGKSGTSSAKQIHAFSLMMPNLRRLEMDYEGSATTLSSERLERLGVLVRSATSLRTLKLRLHGTPLTSEHELFEYEISSDMCLFSPSNKQFAFKQLEVLSLDSLVSYEYEIIRLLRAHSLTLKHLALRNVLLLRNPTDGPRACWVRVIQALRKHLRLTSISFGGFLSNGGLQLWYINNPPSDESSVFNKDRSVKSRVESYITHKSSHLPTEILSVMVQPGAEDIAPPTDAFPWVKGDCTWSMTQRIPLHMSTLPLEPLEDDWADEIVYLDPAPPIPVMPTTTTALPLLMNAATSPPTFVIPPSPGSTYVQHTPHPGESNIHATWEEAADWAQKHSFDEQGYVVEVPFNAGDVLENFDFDHPLNDAGGY